MKNETRIIIRIIIFSAVILTSAFLLSFKDNKNIPDLKKPNVLLIITDQLNIETMSAMGNPYLHTPNMDRMAKRGMMFKNAYTSSPVCGPARSSIVTGRMPHETGVEWNPQGIKDGIKNVGEIFGEAGYKTVWAGKWHLPESYPQQPGAKQKSIKGFEMLPFGDQSIKNWGMGSETDPHLTKAAVKFLSSYKDEAPFFLAVNYCNPHDICFYPRKKGWVSENDSLLEIRYYGYKYKFPAIIGNHPGNISNLPPLPQNYARDKTEPQFLTDKRDHHQIYGLETYLAYNEFNDLEWQGYLNTYYRLTEKVDAEIGKVLDVLEASGRGENTIIVFTSDHGDGAAAHQWAAKLSFYKESSMVPMLVSFPGQIPENRVDKNNLVSLIDIVPTLCDYAGVKTVVPFTGKSMRGIIEKPNAAWRDFLVVELADYAPDKSRKGRMVRSADFTFNIFSEGKRNEQLFQVEKDKGENNNLAFNEDFKKIRNEHLGMLKIWMEETNDNFIIPPSN